MIRRRSTAQARRHLTIVGSEPESEQLSGAVVGEIVGIEKNAAVVRFSGSPEARPMVARTNVPLCREHVGRKVTLVFEKGDPARPIVVGLLQPTVVRLADKAPIEAYVDRERLVLEAHEQIELKCGKASLLLTADGRVIIKGANILSRASGANKIRGGSVHLN